MQTLRLKVKFQINITLVIHTLAYYKMQNYRILDVLFNSREESLLLQ